MLTSFFFKYAIFLTNHTTIHIKRDVKMNGNNIVNIMKGIGVCVCLAVIGGSATIMHIIIFSWHLVVLL